jgi:hypothetical protein
MWQALIPLFGNIIDKVLPDPQAAADAKIKMLEMAQKGELAELSARAEIVKTEAASQSWLASSWRPITMLVFTGLIVARWFGWSAPNLSEAEYIKLWDIVELGLGGYVIGRSVEKIAPAVAGALKK